MKIVFAGAGPFGLPALEALAEEREVRILKVYTKPDRPKGRGRVKSPTQVGEAAARLGLPLSKPESLREVEEELKELKPDILLVVDYGEIVPDSILKIPEIGPFNIHGSLLPRWRGAAPSAWAVKAGDTESGVTIFRLVKKLDAGPILCQKRVPILPDDTAETLEKRLAEVGALLLLEALPRLRSGDFTLKEQDPALVTFAPKLKKQDGLIRWEEPAASVERHIRAMQPWPRAVSFLQRRVGEPLRVIFLRVTPLEERPEGVQPGTVVSVGKDGFKVACGRGAVEVKRLQPAGKRPMEASEFLRGHRIEPGDRFSAEAPEGF